MFNWFKKKEDKVQVAVMQPRVEVEVKPTIRMERVNKAVALYEETLRKMMADETITKSRFDKQCKQIHWDLKQTVDSDLLTQEEYELVAPRALEIRIGLKNELHELVVARGTLGPAETPKGEAPTSHPVTNQELIDEEVARFKSALGTSDNKDFHTVNMIAKKRKQRHNKLLEEGTLTQYEFEQVRAGCKIILEEFKKLIEPTVEETVVVEERIIPDTKRGAPAGCYTYKNDRFALEDFREMFSRWPVAPEVSYGE